MNKYYHVVAQVTGQVSRLHHRRAEGFRRKGLFKRDFYATRCKSESVADGIGRLQLRWFEPLSN